VCPITQPPAGRDILGDAGLVKVPLGLLHLCMSPGTFERWSACIWTRGAACTEHAREASGTSRPGAAGSLLSQAQELWRLVWILHVEVPVVRRVGG
jgi:hypothetical protein